MSRLQGVSVVACRRHGGALRLPWLFSCLGHIRVPWPRRRRRAREISTNYTRPPATFVTDSDLGAAWPARSSPGSSLRALVSGRTTSLLARCRCRVTLSDGGLLSGALPMAQGAPAVPGQLVRRQRGGRYRRPPLSAITKSFT